MQDLLRRPLVPLEMTEENKKGGENQNGTES